MTFVVDGTNGLTFPNSTTQASAGKILQVVNGTTTTETSSSSSTFADTTLTATITPKFSTSTIYVLVNQNGLAKYSGSAASALDLNLVENGTSVVNWTVSSGYTGASDYNFFGASSFATIRSPATTSSITYKTQFKNQANTSLVRVQESNSTSSITLMEIAA